MVWARTSFATMSSAWYVCALLGTTTAAGCGACWTTTGVPGATTTGAGGGWTTTGVPGGTTTGAGAGAWTTAVPVDGVAKPWSSGRVPWGPLAHPAISGATTAAYHAMRVLISNLPESG